MDRALIGRRATRFGPLLVLGILQATSGLIYASMGSAPSPAATTILGLSLGLYIIYWTVDDARRRRRVPCFDFGFLLAIFFPISVIWYAFWTRGRRGVLLLLALVGLIYGPWLCATIVWLAVHSGG